jgi:DHA1 family tetracycline resistance protein-like MFS transporter
LPGFVASAMSAVALALAVFKLPESLSTGESTSGHRTLIDRRALRSALSVPSVGLLLLTAFIAVFSFANFESTLSVQIEHLVSDSAKEKAPLVGWFVRVLESNGYEDRQDVALIVICTAFAYLGIILTLAQGVLVRRLADRLQEGTMAVAGALAALAGFLLLAWATLHGSFILLLAAMAVEVLGFALVNPSLQSLISRRSDPAQQGGILGLSQSATSLARIFGPVFGLRLFKQSPELPYYGAAGLMVLALLLIVASVRSGSDFGS